MWFSVTVEVLGSPPRRADRDEPFLTSDEIARRVGLSMKSLNIIALLLVSSIAYACGSSTPPAESPEPEAAAAAPAGDAGAPAP